VAKLQTYKFVNPGVSKVKSPSVAGARKQTLALNRLGSTISGIGTVVKDIENISIAQIKNDKLREKAERRRDRRELDQAAEEAIENKKLAKRKPKLTKRSLKIAKGSLSWIEKFLAPIGKFLGFLARIAITKELLEWVGDPANVEKLSDFLEKTHFVFSKLFGWAAGFTNNILDGFSALSDPNSTFIQRLGGLGTIMKGLIGLKYLMNPFSIITDILALIDLLTGDRGSNRRGGDKNKNKNKNKNQNKNKNPNNKFKPKTRPGEGFRNKTTTSGGQSTGPLRGIREWIKNTKRFFGQKPNVSVGGQGGGGWWQKLFGQKASDRVSSGGTPKKPTWWDKLFKKKNFTQSGQTGNWWTRNWNKVTKGQGGKSGLGTWWSNLFKQGTVTTGTGGIKPTWWTRVKGAGTKIKGAGATPLQIIATLVADYTINEIVDAVITDPMQRRVDKSNENKVNERFLATGSEETIKFYETELAKLQEARSKQGWFGKLGLGQGNKLDDVRQATLQKQLNYARTISENRDISKIFENFKSNNKTEKKKTSNWFSNLFGGSKKNEEKKTEDKFIKSSFSWSSLFGNKKKEEKKNETKKNWWNPFSWGKKASGGKLPGYGIGGFFKGIKKAVSGAWNAVTKIASNPIVGTALSFIPGMQIPMAVINGVNSAMSGDIMGALSAGLGGLGAFANINTVNAISQPQWLQNLRFSGFGQGVANMYHSGANAWGALTNGVNNIMGSKWGQIGQQVLGGDYMGALNTFNPKWGGIASDIMSGNYGGALGAFNPEMGAAVTKGMAMIDSFRQDPMGLISGIAEQQGMGGLLKAVTGLFGGGDKITAMTQIAAEMGIDPKVLGAVKSAHQQALTKGGISAEYALEQAMEFIPIPTIIEKIVTIPQAVAINTGGGTQIIVTAPNSLLERAKGS